MRCPFCNSSDNKVVDTRVLKEKNEIRRRRKCYNCGERFTTYERVEEHLPMVIKKDGRREPFSPEKILNGIKKACEKRPISIPLMEEICEKIKKEVMESGEKEIPATIIGEKVMSHLHEIDGVAYVRFASVYREFKDINEFMEQIKGLLEHSNENKDA